MDNKLFSTILVLICTVILLGCNNLAEPEPITNKDTDTIKNQNLFRFEKSPIDQVININVLMYDAYPLSAGVDWNLKSKVPYPCDSLFNARGIYFDEEFECWRLSEQARKEHEKIQQEAFTPVKEPEVIPFVSKEDEVTQINEEVPVIEKPKVTQPNQKTAVEQTQPSMNQRVLYKGGNSTNSVGVLGQPGESNNTDGFNENRNYGSAGSGNGLNYNLSGRGAKSLHHPDDDFSEEGTVVIDIWVNPAGQVVRAEISSKGTTVINSDMRQKAKQAALRSTFAADPNAPEEQHGTITYTFVINK